LGQVDQQFRKMPFRTAIIKIGNAKGDWSWQLVLQVWSKTQGWRLKYPSPYTRLPRMSAIWRQPSANLPVQWFNPEQQNRK
jgi:hypothetical protein